MSLTHSPITRLLRWPSPRFQSTFRALSCSAAPSIKQMPPRPTIDESEVTVKYLKGSGPGGQKINKTSSAVQLIHLPTNTVVKSQASRSRSQNHKVALRILAEKIERLQKGDQSRAAIVAETRRKRKASKVKKSKRKYRALEVGREEKEEGGEQEGKKVGEKRKGEGEGEGEGEG
ncbi:hypothetical protein PRK78_007020 [Emydomyces testavorans]|uniref:Prokaryotic-type class I peptide chain release factors domain-containing protein n=1 Tax=Emydomyces testavorans TaxID=2070801 RepID=A0AAF0DMF3_9EURO|nr:hypothetical protein PRK78_007020 [Emydomyces testavorans]